MGVKVIFNFKMSEPEFLQERTNEFKGTYYTYFKYRSGFLKIVAFQKNLFI